MSRDTASNAPDRQPSQDSRSRQAKRSDVPAHRKIGPESEDRSGPEAPDDSLPEPLDPAVKG
ncbi:MAG: hypothetical protein JO227_00475 [Acetobacteraceae bacterium]|nr:hypothetical protein [Acetobacteraceae bacterium]